MELRGNALFMDLVEDPELTDHLFEVVTETLIRVARLLRARTGTTSLAVNRSIADVDAGLHLTSNCSVSMMSPRLYQQRILAFERRAAGVLAPFGIHHCGANLQRYAAEYSELEPKFLDVGYGSDVAECARLFPDAFLNLRMNPVALLQESSADVRMDALAKLRACGRSANVGVCAINLDPLTPDENVRALFAAAWQYERESSAD
jgi:hypothetical protein